MIWIRRILLAAFAIAVPAILTALMYVGSEYLLFVTRRTIDPKVLHYAAAIEFPVFLFVAVLEVKHRW